MKTQLTKDWQITIPSEIRHRLGLREGDELLLIVTDREIRLRPVKKRRLSEFRGTLPATKPYPGKAAIRKVVAESLARKISES
ncbi:AbrB/MazE/SpoVT family DNA-binding domain-containing protein [Pleurocapsales cyanobacterium LEGE 06147]|nr:AbrB/MazE/SpoVT family DNA-binding domain-containing protein [Pleurocapsales cyanobacterium LEGE 06147]